MLQVKSKSQMQQAEKSASRVLCSQGGQYKAQRSHTTNMRNATAAYKHRDN